MQVRFIPSDHIQDFLSDNHFLLLESPGKKQAELILDAWCNACEKLPDDDLHLADQEKILFSGMQSLNLTADIRKSIPEIVSCFFQYLYTSGVHPPARQWDEDLALLTPRFVERVRDDGTMKGETFTKKYSETGRNDPCPCGSGKKFKKCCMGLIN